MTTLGVKDKHHKNMCYNNIKLCPQNVDTILSSILKPHKWEGNKLMYVHSVSTFFFFLKYFIQLFYNFYIWTSTLELELTIFES